MKTRHAALAALLSLAFFGCAPAPEPLPRDLSLVSSTFQRPIPDESRRHYEAAVDLNARGEFERARLEAQRAVEADHENIAARKLLNDLQQIMVGGAPDWEALISKLKKSYETTEEGKKSDAEASYRLAERYYQAGDFEKATLECEKALRLDPNHVPAKALNMEVQFLLGRGKVTASSDQYDKAMKEALTRHQQTTIELDNALAAASRAYNMGDYENAAKELLRIKETSRWMPSGVDLQARQQQAQELLKRTVESSRQRGLDEEKSRLRLIEEEKARDDLRPSATRTDWIARAEEELKKGPGITGVFGNSIQRAMGAPVDQLLVIEKRAPGGPQQQYETRGGELTVRRGEKVVPLPLKHTDVKGQISLTIAAVDVTQQYHNPYDEKIEAVYSFPLPDDAAVSDFVMTIGTRRIRGIVREREEAKAIYVEARRQGYVASLLAQERPNVFTQSVANIEPGKGIDVTIRYFHALRPTSEGAYEFVFPMVVGPRFNPPGSQDGIAPVALGGAGTSGQKTEIQYLRPDEISLHDLALEVSLDAGLPIEELSSPSHVIRAERPGPARARVTLSPNDRVPNKDFILRYRVAGSSPRAALATYRDGTGGYFTLVLQPPKSIADVPRPSREMIFVLDVSGSMAGQPLAAAKRALERCLRRLEPDDTFQIVRFADTAQQMEPQPVAATATNVRRGLRYMEESSSAGGTMMMEGILASLATPNPAGRHRIVSFMTDGLIGNDPEILAAVKQRIGGARIFSFGVGSEPNRYLLEGLARLGRGVSAYVGLDDSGELAADALYRRIEHPAMTDLRIDWDRMNVSEVHPDPLPDLFVGKPVVLCGRFKGDGASTISVRGRVGGKPVELQVPVDLGDPGLQHKALAAVWARSKIESLRDGLAGSAAAVELRREIRALALQFGLASEFTSFVAVDSLTCPPGDHGTTVPVAVPVPEGVRYDTTVGPRSLR